MAVGLQDGSTQVPRINITPLVDVLLVLLVIFMVATPVLSRTLAMELPGTGEGAKPAEDLRLQIGMAGDYSLAGQPLAREALVPALREALVQSPQLRLRIAAADDSDYQAFVAALAAARQAGIDNIGAEMR
ncbi:MAG: biopolymer transporter ExbD [Gammaproteobacteria bacterium]|nr:biopolymer transporter ExbD [Gammaproteobacteria bacterium]